MSLRVISVQNPKPMSRRATNRKTARTGNVRFSIESRVLRELGERLVKKPEVALLELIKNAYDADATECVVDATEPGLLTIVDDGHGMTMSQFRKSWMRVGTSSKSNKLKTPKYGRVITGEKGIGRFAVRFLGQKLQLISVADDAKSAKRTKLTVDFNWPGVDRTMDLEKVSVPYKLETTDSSEALGTRLVISALRIANLGRINWQQVRTGAAGVVSPLQSLLKSTEATSVSDKRSAGVSDLGFKLTILDGSEEDTESDLAKQILDSFVLRSTIEASAGKFRIRIYENDSSKPLLKINDKYSSSLGSVYADLRFFPHRSGTFKNSPIDGRRAYAWIRENSGVAVFDRGFRVLPYGSKNDDWLRLAADTARNVRVPRSWIANKWFPMTEPEQRATSENWMLRLPQSAQMVGLVRVEGQRNSKQTDSDGLIAAADREGFLENETFDQFWHLVRGAIELVAVADRQVQRRNEKLQQEDALEKSREETLAAIREIEEMPSLSAAQKKRIASMLVDSQERVESQEVRSSQREAQLQVMSLLGVIAGYMTHEFGVALTDLETAQTKLKSLARKHSALMDPALALDARIARLKDFSTYVHAYVEGVRKLPNTKFAIRPRIKQVTRLLGDYAKERGIKVEISVERDLASPAVPVTLYNGILQNLFTNALKAVSAHRGVDDMTIAFRAWNDKKWHHLQVSDTGIGIPPALEKFVFDPLFSTTDINKDPVGSGMGLGLSLVRRCVEAFSGKVDLISAPPGFVTCVDVSLPLFSDSGKT